MASSLRASGFRKNVGDFLGIADNASTPETFAGSILAGLLPAPQGNDVQAAWGQFRGGETLVTQDGLTVSSEEMAQTLSPPAVFSGTNGLMPSVASTITVTTTADEMTDNGQTSLREALALANANPGPDTIVFAAGPGQAFANGGTITLSLGQLDVSGDITINGDVNGDGIGDVTINANQTSRVLDVNGGTAGPGTANLNGLTITGGLFATGGGILVRVAGQVLNFTNGSIVNNSTTDAGGGGGGGLFIINGSANLTNVTVSGNSTANASNGFGGGIILQRNGSLTLTNTTVSGNSSATDSGGIDSSGTLTIINSTISGNSGAQGTGGLYVFEGATTVRNSIILGNAGSQVGSEPGVIPTITTSITSGDQTLVFAAIDPMTGGGLLANNGGPVRTIALRDAVNNPAIDQGNDAQAPATDARGLARVDRAGNPNNGGNFSDIGAFELQAAINTPPSIANLQGDVAVWMEHQTPTLLDSGTGNVLTDSDSPNFDGGSLTIAITGGLVAAQDELLIRTTNGISFAGSAVSYNGVQIGTFTGAGAGGGPLVITFDADATIIAVQNLIRAIGYQNSGGDNPSQGARTITWTLVDGDGTAGGGNDTVTVTSTVNVVGVNDAPAVDLNGAAFGSNNTASYTEQDPVVTLAPDIVLSDVDNTTLAGAIVQVTGGFVPLAGDGADYLGISGSGAGTINGINYSYSATTGILTLSGSATVAVYQAVLAQVTFQSTTNNPGASKTITWTVNDGTANSSPVTTTITVTQVNDAPVNSVPLATQNGTEDTNLVFSSGNGNAITVADLDASSLTVTLSAANGVLTLSGTAGLSFGIGDGTGDPTMTFTGTAAAINAALNGLIYRGNLNYEGADTLTITTTDNGQTGAGGTQADTDMIAISLADDGVIHGDANDNVLVGTAGIDFFDLRQGGDDTVSGLGGNDGFYFGGAYTSADSVDGGAGSLDQIGLQGDYSGGVTLGALTGVELVVLLSGGDARFGDTANNFYDYNITAPDSAVAAGGRLILQANTLRAGEDFTFDGSAESDGAFLIYGGLGVDNLTSGAGNDGFFFGAGGRFAPGDVVNGGAGNMDQIGLQGNYTIDFNAPGYAGAISGIEFIVLLSASDNRFGSNGGSVSYNLVMANANVAAGQTMVIQANTLKSDQNVNETLAFNGSAETDGRFEIFGGGGNDVLTGGSGNDRISGGARGDTLTGGAGNDIFVYSNVTDSNSTERDGIQDFTLGDRIDLSLIDANINLGGNQDFTFVGTSAFSNTAGELRYENISLGGPIWLIQGDVNGDGVSDLEIVYVLTDGHALTVNDFIGVNLAQEPLPVKAAASGEVDGMLVMDLAGPDMLALDTLGAPDDMAGLAATGPDGAKGGYLDMAFARDFGGPDMVNLLGGTALADDLTMFVSSHDLTF